MSCRRCGEQDNFNDGNPSEELCKHCLDHVCEHCFNEIHTEKEEETMTCSDCYEPEEPKFELDQFKTELKPIIAETLENIMNQ